MLFEAKKIVFILLCCLIFPLTGKAQKQIKYADLEFERGYWEEAIELYEKLIKAPENEDDFSYLSQQLALANYYLKNYSEAHYHFQNIETKVKSFNSETKQAYFDCLRLFKEYKLAQTYLKQDLEDPYYKEHFIDFPIHYQTSAKDSFFNIKSINIDHGYSFLGLSIINNDSIAIALPISNEKQKTVFYDLFTTKRKEDTLFNTAENRKIIDDKKKVFYRGTPTLFTNNNIIFSGNISEYSLYKEKDIAKYNISENGENLLHLFQVKPGSTQESILPINDQNSNSSTPFFDTINNVLFFSSDRTQGHNNFDIYYSFYVNNTWSTPHPLEIINSPYDDIYPFYFNNQLFFSSKGHQNFGGLDLFVSVCDIDSTNQTITLSPPQNLGTTINSSFDDFSLIWNSTYNGYLASNRIDKNKQDHLFYFDYTPIDTLIFNIFNQYNTPINAKIYCYSKLENGEWTLSDSLKYTPDTPVQYPVNLKKEYQFEFKKNNHLSKIIHFEKDYNYIQLKKAKKSFTTVTLNREPSIFTLRDKYGTPIPNADIIIYSKDVPMGAFETDNKGFWDIENRNIFDASSSYTLKYQDKNGEEQTITLNGNEIIQNNAPVRDFNNKLLTNTLFNITADKIKEAELTTDFNGEYRYDFNDNLTYDIEIKAVDYELKQIDFAINQEDYELERGRPQYDIKIDKSKSSKAVIEKVINPINQKVLFTLKDENGTPLPFTDISIYGKNIKIGTFDTDANGFWDISDSTLFNQDGSYTVKYIDKSGTEQSIQLEGKNILEQQTALLDNNNNLISNTSIDVYSDREKLADITTDINGQYEYDFDENIEYDIEINAVDYEIKEVEFVFEQDDYELDRGQPQYDIHIDRSPSNQATITKVTHPETKNTLFTLRDADGTPIPFADITIYGKDIKLGTFETDDNGLWDLKDSTRYDYDGSYTIKFIDKYGDEQVIQLEGKEILNGNRQLRDEDNTILKNTSIDVYSDREKLAELTTDKNGQYEYDFDENITYDIEIKVADYTTQTIELDFEQIDELDRGNPQYDIKIDPKGKSKPTILAANQSNREEKIEMEVIQSILSEKLKSFDNIYFDYNSYKLSKEGYSTLRKVIRYLKEHPDKKVIIYGHTDAVGSSRFNQKLGQKRAASCLKYLQKKGVNNPTNAVSFGKDQLAKKCPNKDCSTEENRINRRVEIFIED
ncbi:MAG: OmpA family protein [Flavobacteriales bacterium]|jgi:outer membrane protein OmpA-like peptidoglycan-associated protein|nr:OmpA family protein [Flavobacteriales bacterium]